MPPTTPSNPEPGASTVIAAAPTAAAAAADPATATAAAATAAPPAPTAMACPVGVGTPACVLPAVAGTSPRACGGSCIALCTGARLCACSVLHRRVRSKSALAPATNASTARMAPTSVATGRPEGVGLGGGLGSGLNSLAAAGGDGPGARDCAVTRVTTRSSSTATPVAACTAEPTAEALCSRSALGETCWPSTRTVPVEEGNTMS